MEACCTVMTQSLLLWDHCHTRFNELTMYTEKDTGTAVLTTFKLTIRENIHADMHMRCHSYQIIIINTYVAHLKQEQDRFLDRFNNQQMDI